MRDNSLEKFVSTLYEQKFGLSIEVPGAAILRIFGFDALAFWTDLGGLAIIFGTSRCCHY